MPTSVNKSGYYLAGETITITLNSLASGSAQCSVALDNTAALAPPLDFTPRLFLDVFVVVQITTVNQAQHGQVRIWAYGTADGGSDYGDGVPGTDSLVTLTVPANLQLIGTIAAPNPSSLNTVYTSNPMSVAAAFCGHLPEHWGIVVENQLSSAFNTTGNGAWYQGLYELVQ